MPTFPLLGFEITSMQAAILGIAYILLSVLAIVLLPRWSVAIPDDQPLENQAKLLEMRARVRQTVIQVVGGIVAVVGVIGTLQQFRRDDDAFTQKKAELFAKSVKAVMDAASGPETRAEALYVLSYIAKSDVSYHRAVFDALASYVRDQSKRACANDNHRTSKFEKDRTIQLAMTLIGERRLHDDATGKQFNLEHGCFAGIDLRDEWGIVNGLAHARLSGSKMLRIDFTRVSMPRSELMGIEAGDHWNPQWSVEIGRKLHQGSKGDDRTGTTDGSLRRRYVAHFIDADLEYVNFSGAGLQGTDFSGAKLKGAQFYGAAISRANFNGAQGLSVEQFETACVGKAEWTAQAIKLEQPYFDENFRAELGKHTVLKNGIAPCP